MTIYRYKQFFLSLYCSIHYVQKSIKITTHIQKKQLYKTNKKQKALLSRDKVINRTRLKTQITLWSYLTENLKQL